MDVKDVRIGMLVAVGEHPESQLYMVERLNDFDALLSYSVEGKQIVCANTICVDYLLKPSPEQLDHMVRTMQLSCPHNNPLSHNPVYSKTYHNGAI